MQQSTNREEVFKNPRSVIRINRKLLFQIGCILKEVREKNLLSLRDIKEETCIPVHHIYAIESGAREKLPEDFFLMGFIKRYAKVLGLDEKIFLGACHDYSTLEPEKPKTDDFDLLFTGNDETEDSVEEDQGFIRVYHIYIFIASILLACVCYFTFQFIRNAVSNPDIRSNKSQNSTQTGNSSSFVLEKDSSEEITKDRWTTDMQQTHKQKEVTEKQVKKINLNIAGKKAVVRHPMVLRTKVVEKEKPELLIRHTVQFAKKQESRQVADIQNQGMTGIQKDTETIMLRPLRQRVQEPSENGLRGKINY